MSGPSLKKADAHSSSFPLRYPARAPQQYRARNGYNKNGRS